MIVWSRVHIYPSRRNDNCIVYNEWYFQLFSIWTLHLKLVSFDVANFDIKWKRVPVRTRRRIGFEIWAKISYYYLLFCRKVRKPYLNDKIYVIFPKSTVYIIASFMQLPKRTLMRQTHEISIEFKLKELANLSAYLKGRFFVYLDFYAEHYCRFRDQTIHYWLNHSAKRQSLIFLRLYGPVCTFWTFWPF